MNPTNPNPWIETFGDATWDTLGTNSPDTDVSSRTLRLALEAKYAQAQRLQEQMIGLVKSLPIPAILLTRNNRIVAVNQQARSLMTNIDWTKPRNRADEVWEMLGWPRVPFKDWEWEEGRLSCWEQALGVPDQPGNLLIRYLRNEPLLQSIDDEHRERLIAIGNTTDRLAHNIRNPLTSLELFATLLQRADQSSQNFRNLVQYLIQTIRSLNGLMTNLLRFGHSMTPHREEIDLSSVFNEVNLQAAHLIQKHQITLQFHQAPDLLKVEADEVFLTQALLNILENAIQASQSGGTIEIMCERGSNVEMDLGSGVASDGIVFSIQDQGCGMSEEERSKVFHPFYSKRKGGTGLGLAIVKQIVQIHQGMITIKSEEGKGTTVRLFLPQKRSREW